LRGTGSAESQTAAWSGSIHRSSCWYGIYTHTLIHTRTAALQLLCAPHRQLEVGRHGAQARRPVRVRHLSFLAQAGAAAKGGARPRPRDLAPLALTLRLSPVMGLEPGNGAGVSVCTQDPAFAVRGRGCIAHLPRREKSIHKLGNRQPPENPPSIQINKKGARTHSMWGWLARGYIHTQGMSRDKSGVVNRDSNIAGGGAGGGGGGASSLIGCVLDQSKD
jgi:hypothetical protein